MKLANHWMLVAHRGLLALAFALLTLVGTDKSLAWFAPLMLFYAMGDGVLAIAASARAAYARERWVCFLIEGLAGLCGIAAITIWPTAKFPELTWALSGWATITAIAVVVTAASLGRRVTSEWLLAAAGVTLVRFAVLAIGAIRAYEFAIALWSTANALVFALVILARIVRLRLVSEASAAIRIQPFAAK
jgi:hypothetical protein